MALSSEDKQLVRQIATTGEHVLREKGWDKRKREEFMRRSDVLRELKAINESFQDREGIVDRVKFLGVLDNSKMVAQALNIRRRALFAGEKLADGTVVEPPTDQQLLIANDVLNRAGIDASDLGGTSSMAIAGDVTINALNVGGENMSHSDGVAMREKLRTMIQSLLSKNVKQIKGNLIDGSVELTKKKKKKKTIDVEVEDDEA
jgi:hypothetical protein